VVLWKLREKFRDLEPTLTERSRRWLAAAEARSLGYGGVDLVARATGMSHRTISRGIRELKRSRGRGLPPERVRRPGGGRKSLPEKFPRLTTDLESLVEPVARGDPESPLRWTIKSLRTLTEQLRKMGHRVSPPAVGHLLTKAGYSLQANRKTLEGSRHPDRNKQFEHIHREVLRQQRSGQPVISVDTKKKELVGDFKREGREWCPRGQARRVRVHDFIIPEKGKAIPYGVYDLARNEGWVSIGIDHDTATFAVNSIERWWTTLGRSAYRKAKSVMITADAGGSNSARSRLWKWGLQKLADRTGLTIRMCHFPPGTSKWNKIEHRLFSFISRNWRGQPLTSLAVIVDLIAATRTKEGLRVRCELDEGRYPDGQKVTDEQMAAVRIEPARFHGEWNYIIRPHIVGNRTVVY